MQTIQIACVGADLVDLQHLVPFQGNLKDLSTENYHKLKKEIIDLGFSEPVSVWKHDSKLFLLNGHQRVRTLQKMQSEGFIITKIPVNYVTAKDVKEAKKKVLSLTSQFGEITSQGLHEFLIESDIDISDVIESFRFPEIDFGEFLSEFSDIEIPEITNTETTFTLEVSFANEASLLDVYESLLEQGHLVKNKSK